MPESLLIQPEPPKQDPPVGSDNERIHEGYKNTKSLEEYINQTSVKANIKALYKNSYGISGYHSSIGSLFNESLINRKIYHEYEKENIPKINPNDHPDIQNLTLAKNLYIANDNNWKTLDINKLKKGDYKGKVIILEPQDKWKVDKNNIPIPTYRELTDEEKGNPYLLSRALNTSGGYGSADEILERGVTGFLTRVGTESVKLVKDNWENIRNARYEASRFPHFSLFQDVLKDIAKTQKVKYTPLSFYEENDTPEQAALRDILKKDARYFQVLSLVENKRKQENYEFTPNEWYEKLWVNIGAKYIMPNVNVITDALNGFFDEVILNAGTVKNPSSAAFSALGIEGNDLGLLNRAELFKSYAANLSKLRGYKEAHPFADRPKNVDELFSNFSIDKPSTYPEAFMSLITPDFYETAIPFTIGSVVPAIPTLFVGGAVSKGVQGGAKLGGAIGSRILAKTATTGSALGLAGKVVGKGLTFTDDVINAKFSAIYRPISKATTKYLPGAVKAGESLVSGVGEAYKAARSTPLKPLFWSGEKLVAGASKIIANPAASNIKILDAFMANYFANNTFTKIAVESIYQDWIRIGIDPEDAAIAAQELGSLYMLTSAFLPEANLKPFFVNATKLHEQAIQKIALNSLYGPQAVSAYLKEFKKDIVIPTIAKRVLTSATPFSAEFFDEFKETLHEEIASFHLYEKYKNHPDKILVAERMLSGGMVSADEDGSFNYVRAFNNSLKGALLGFGSGAPTAFLQGIRQFKTNAKIEKLASVSDNVLSMLEFTDKNTIIDAIRSMDLSDVAKHTLGTFSPDTQEYTLQLLSPSKLKSSHVGVSTIDKTKSQLLFELQVLKNKGLATEEDIDAVSKGDYNLLKMFYETFERKTGIKPESLNAEEFLKEFLIDRVETEIEINKLFGSTKKSLLKPLSWFNVDNSSYYGLDLDENDKVFLKNFHNKYTKKVTDTLAHQHYLQRYIVDQEAKLKDVDIPPAEKELIKEDIKNAYKEYDNLSTRLMVMQSGGFVELAKANLIYFKERNEANNLVLSEEETKNNVSLLNKKQKALQAARINFLHNQAKIFNSRFDPEVSKYFEKTQAKNTSILDVSIANSPFNLLDLTLSNNGDVIVRPKIPNAEKLNNYLKNISFDSFVINETLKDAEGNPIEAFDFIGIPIEPKTYNDINIGVSSNLFSSFKNKDSLNVFKNIIKSLNLKQLEDFETKFEGIFNEKAKEFFDKFVKRLKERKKQIENEATVIGFDPTSDDQYNKISDFITKYENTTQSPESIEKLKNAIIASSEEVKKYLDDLKKILKLEIDKKKLLTNLSKDLELESFTLLNTLEGIVQGLIEDNNIIQNGGLTSVGIESIINKAKAIRNFVEVAKGTKETIEATDTEPEKVIHIAPKLDDLIDAFKVIAKVFDAYNFEPELDYVLNQIDSFLNVWETKREEVAKKELASINLHNVNTLNTLATEIKELLKVPNIPAATYDVLIEISNRLQGSTESSLKGSVSDYLVMLDAASNIPNIDNIPQLKNTKLYQELGITGNIFLGGESKSSPEVIAKNTYNYGKLLGYLFNMDSKSVITDSKHVEAARLLMTIFGKYRGEHRNSVMFASDLKTFFAYLKEQKIEVNVDKITTLNEYNSTAILYEIQNKIKRLHLIKQSQKSKNLYDQFLKILEEKLTNAEAEGLYLSLEQVLSITDIVLAYLSKDSSVVLLGKAGAGKTSAVVATSVEIINQLSGNNVVTTSPNETSITPITNALSALNPSVIDHKGDEKNAGLTNLKNHLSTNSNNIVVVDEAAYGDTAYVEELKNLVRTNPNNFFVLLGDPSQIQKDVKNPAVPLLSTFNESLFARPVMFRYRNNDPVIKSFIANIESSLDDYASTSGFSSYDENLEYGVKIFESATDLVELIKQKSKEISTNPDEKIFVITNSESKKVNYKKTFNDVKNVVIMTPLESQGKEANYVFLDMDPPKATITSSNVEAYNKQMLVAATRTKKFLGLVGNDIGETPLPYAEIYKTLHSVNYKHNEFVNAVNKINEAVLSVANTQQTLNTFNNLFDEIKNIKNLTVQDVKKIVQTRKDLRKSLNESKKLINESEPRDIQIYVKNIQNGKEIDDAHSINSISLEYHEQLKNKYEDLEKDINFAVTLTSEVIAKSINSLGKKSKKTPIVNGENAAPITDGTNVTGTSTAPLTPPDTEVEGKEVEDVEDVEEVEVEDEQQIDSEAEDLADAITEQSDVDVDNEPTTPINFVDGKLPEHNKILSGEIDPTEYDTLYDIVRGLNLKDADEQFEDNTALQNPPIQFRNLLNNLIKNYILTNKEEFTRKIENQIKEITDYYNTNLTVKIDGSASILQPINSTLIENTLKNIRSKIIELTGGGDITNVEIDITDVLNYETGNVGEIDNSINKGILYNIPMRVIGKGGLWTYFNFYYTHDFSKFSEVPTSSYARSYNALYDAKDPKANKASYYRNKYVKLLNSALLDHKKDDPNVDIDSIPCYIITTEIKPDGKDSIIHVGGKKNNDNQGINLPVKIEVLHQISNNLNKIIGAKKRVRNILEEANEEEKKKIYSNLKVYETDGIQINEEAKIEAEIASRLTAIYKRYFSNFLPLRINVLIDETGTNLLNKNILLKAIYNDEEKNKLNVSVEQLDKVRNKLIITYNQKPIAEILPFSKINPPALFNITSEEAPLYIYIKKTNDFIQNFKPEEEGSIESILSSLQASDLTAGIGSATFAANTNGGTIAQLIEAMGKEGLTSIGKIVVNVSNTVVYDETYPDVINPSIEYIPGSPNSKNISKLPNLEKGRAYLLFKDANDVVYPLPLDRRNFKSVEEIEKLIDSWEETVKQLQDKIKRENLTEEDLKKDDEFLRLENEIHSFVNANRDLTMALTPLLIRTTLSRKIFFQHGPDPKTITDNLNIIKEQIRKFDAAYRQKYEQKNGRSPLYTAYYKYIVLPKGKNHKDLFKNYSINGVPGVGQIFDLNDVANSIDDVVYSNIIKFTGVEIQARIPLQQPQQTLRRFVPQSTQTPTTSTQTTQAPSTPQQNSQNSQGSSQSKVDINNFSFSKRSIEDNDYTDYNMSELEAKGVLTELFGKTFEKYGQTNIEDNLKHKGIPLNGYYEAASILSGDVKATIGLNRYKGKVSRKAVYHEAFHLIFDGFVTDSEKRKYLDYVKKKYLKNTKSSDIEAEEWMADTFQELRPYKDTILNKLFSYLKELVYILIGRTYDPKFLFNRAQRGYYKGKLPNLSNDHIYYSKSGRIEAKKSLVNSNKNELLAPFTHNKHYYDFIYQYRSQLVLDTILNFSALAINNNLPPTNLSFGIEERFKKANEVRNVLNEIFNTFTDDPSKFYLSLREYIESGYSSINPLQELYEIIFDENGYIRSEFDEYFDLINDYDNWLAEVGLNPDPTRGTFNNQLITDIYYTYWMVNEDKKIRKIGATLLSLITHSKANIFLDEDVKDKLKKEELEIIAKEKNTNVPIDDDDLYDGSEEADVEIKQEEDSIEEQTDAETKKLLKNLGGLNASVDTQELSGFEGIKLLLSVVPKFASSKSLGVFINKLNKVVELQQIPIEQRTIEQQKELFKTLVDLTQNVRNRSASFLYPEQALKAAYIEVNEFKKLNPGVPLTPMTFKTYLENFILKTGNYIYDEYGNEIIVDEEEKINLDNHRLSILSSLYVALYGNNSGSYSPGFLLTVQEQNIIASNLLEQENIKIKLNQAQNLFNSLFYYAESVRDYQYATIKIDEDGEFVLRFDTVNDSLENTRNLLENNILEFIGNKDKFKYTSTEDYASIKFIITVNKEQQEYKLLFVNGGWRLFKNETNVVNGKEIKDEKLIASGNENFVSSSNETAKTEAARFAFSLFNASLRVNVSKLTADEYLNALNTFFTTIIPEHIGTESTKSTTNNKDYRNATLDLASQLIDYSSRLHNSHTLNAEGKNVQGTGFVTPNDKHWKRRANQLQNMFKENGIKISSSAFSLETSIDILGIEYTFYDRSTQKKLTSDELFGIDYSLFRQSLVKNKTKKYYQRMPTIGDSSRVLLAENAKFFTVEDLEKNYNAEINKAIAIVKLFLEQEQIQFNHKFKNVLYEPVKHSFILSHFLLRDQSITITNIDEAAQHIVSSLLNIANNDYVAFKNVLGYLKPEDTLAHFVCFTLNQYLNSIAHTYVLVGNIYGYKTTKLDSNRNIQVVLQSGSADIQKRINLPNNMGNPGNYSSFRRNNGQSKTYILPSVFKKSYDGLAVLVNGTEPLEGSDGISYMLPHYAYERSLKYGGTYNTSLGAVTKDKNADFDEQTELVNLEKYSLMYIDGTTYYTNQDIFDRFLNLAYKGDQNAVQKAKFLIDTSKKRVDLQLIDTSTFKNVEEKLLHDRKLQKAKYDEFLAYSDLINYLNENNIIPIDRLIDPSARKDSSPISASDQLVTDYLNGGNEIPIISDDSLRTVHEYAQSQIYDPVGAISPNESISVSTQQLYIAVSSFIDSSLKSMEDSEISKYRAQINKLQRASKALFNRGRTKIAEELIKSGVKAIQAIRDRAALDSQQDPTNLDETMYSILSNSSINSNLAVVASELTKATFRWFTKEVAKQTMPGTHYVLQPDMKALTPNRLKWYNYRFDQKKLTDEEKKIFDIDGHEGLMNHFIEVAKKIQNESDKSTVKTKLSALRKEFFNKILESGEVEVRVPYKFTKKFEYLFNEIPKENWIENAKERISRYGITYSSNIAILKNNVANTEGLTQAELNEVEDLITFLQTLQMFGIRIPSTGKNSAIIVKIKEIIDTNVNIMQVPAEVVLFMGSDFDVDKLTTYNYTVTTINDRAFIEVPTEEEYSGDTSKINAKKLKNDLLLNYINLWRLPYSQAQAAKPISYQSVEALIDSPNTTNNVESPLNNPIVEAKRSSGFYGYKNQIAHYHNANSAGTDLVGFGVTFNKVYMLLQSLNTDELPIQLEPLTFFVPASSTEPKELKRIEYKGKIEESKTLFTIGEVPSFIDDLCQTILDNLKIQLTGKLNVSKETVGKMLTMVSLGTPLEDTARFFKHPLIVDYVTFIEHGKLVKANKGRLNKSAAGIDPNKIAKYNLSKEEFRQYLIAQYSNSIGENTAKALIQTFDDIERFERDNIGPFRKFFSLTNGYSPSYTDQIKMIEKYNKILIENPQLSKIFKIIFGEITYNPKTGKHEVTPTIIDGKEMPIKTPEYAEMLAGMMDSLLPLQELWVFGKNEIKDGKVIPNSNTYGRVIEALGNLNVKVKHGIGAKFDHRYISSINNYLISLVQNKDVNDFGETHGEGNFLHNVEVVINKLKDLNLGNYFLNNLQKLDSDFNKEFNRQDIFIFKSKIRSKANENIIAASIESLKEKLDDLRTNEDPKYLDLRNELTEKQLYVLDNFPKALYYYGILTQGTSLQQTNFTKFFHGEYAEFLSTILEEGKKIAFEGDRFKDEYLEDFASQFATFETGLFNYSYKEGATYTKKTFKDIKDAIFRNPKYKGKGLAYHNGKEEQAKNKEKEKSKENQKETSAQKIFVDETFRDPEINKVQLQKLSEKLNKLIPGVLIVTVDTDYLLKHNYNPNVKGLYSRKEGVIYLNSDTVSLETPIHEVAHVVVDSLKNLNPKLYEKLASQVVTTNFFKTVQENYSELTYEAQVEEAMVTAIGFFAVQDDSVKEYLLENKSDKFILRIVKSVWNFFKDLFNKFGYKSYNNFWDEYNAEDLTLEEFADGLAKAILKEKPIARPSVNRKASYNVEVSYMKGADAMFANGSTVNYFSSKVQMVPKLNIPVHLGKTAKITNITDFRKIIDNRVRTIVKNNFSSSTIMTYLTSGLNSSNLNSAIVESILYPTSNISVELNNVPVPTENEESTNSLQLSESLNKVLEIKSFNLNNFLNSDKRQKLLESISYRNYDSEISSVELINTVNDTEGSIIKITFKNGTVSLYSTLLESSSANDLLIDGVIGNTNIPLTIHNLVSLDLASLATEMKEANPDLLFNDIGIIAFHESEKQVSFNIESINLDTALIALKKDNLSSLSFFNMNPEIAEVVKLYNQSKDEDKTPQLLTELLTDLLHKTTATINSLAHSLHDHSSDLAYYTRLHKELFKILNDNVVYNPKTGKFVEMDAGQSRKVRTASRLDISFWSKLLDPKVVDNAVIQQLSQRKVNAELQRNSVLSTIKNAHVKLLKNLEQEYKTSENAKFIKYGEDYGVALTDFMWKVSNGVKLLEFETDPDIIATWSPAQQEYHKFITSVLQGLKEDKPIQFTINGNVSTISIGGKLKGLKAEHLVPSFAPKKYKKNVISNIINVGFGNAHNIGYYDEEAGSQIPLFYLSAKENDNLDMYDRNVADIFDAFVGRAVHKIHLQPIANLYEAVGIVFNLEKDINGNPIFKNFREYVQDLISVHFKETAYQSTLQLFGSEKIDSSGKSLAQRVDEGIDKFLRITTIAGISSFLGGNPVNAVKNLLTGIYYNISTSVAEKLAGYGDTDHFAYVGTKDRLVFTASEYAEAKTIAVRDMLKYIFTGETNKTVELAKIIGVSFDYKLLTAAKERNIDNKINLNWLFVLNHYFDLVVQPAYMIAALKHENIWDDYEFKDGALVFTGNGRSQDPQFRNARDKSYNFSIQSKQGLLSHYGLNSQDVTRITTNLGRLHGTQRLDDQSAAVKHAFFRYVSAMKKWLVPALNALIRPAHLDLNSAKLIEKEIEGEIEYLYNIEIKEGQIASIYDAVTQLPMLHNIVELIRRIRGLHTDDRKPLTKYQYYNLYKFSMNVGLFALIVFWMTSKSDDDDEEENILLKNLMKGLKAEVGFGYDPEDFIGLGNQATPVAFSYFGQIIHSLKKSIERDNIQHLVQVLPARSILKPILQDEDLNSKKKKSDTNEE